MSGLALGHALSCLFMTGLIWLVQLVHYPAFAHVDAAGFARFHAFHSERITWIVLPVMTIELATAVLLVAREGRPWLWNLGGVVLIWAATGLLSVPLHNQLGAAAPEALPGLIDRLVATNWPRTLLWTVRSAALAYLVITAAARR